MAETRKLAAIMVADVVGFSRLTGADEDLTLARLRALRSDLIDPAIAVHNGRVVKRTGDGALVEFRSVVDAVRCAIEVQASMVERNAGLPPERRIEFRIGIHLGDVVEENDGDLMGDGVNIAARLEGIAKPGAICLSEDAYRQVRARLDLAVCDLGETELKNIAEKIHVFSLEIGSPTQANPTKSARSAAAEVGSVKTALTGKPSIAVLPFEYMSGQAEETYFSDGITEDIITGLARFRSLVVVARNSSFAFRGRAVGPAEIGRQLGVSYLLEGSVRRVGDRIRITAQLIEAASAAHIWAERYDRDIADIFAVQDDVGSRIVATLFGRIESEKFQQSLRKPPENLAAYDFLLRGYARFSGSGDNNNSEACELFAKALEADPTYALAEANLALATAALHGFASAPQQVLIEAIERAQHAVDLDPQEGNCHAILSFLLLFSRSYDLAEYHARRSLELNPNDADGAIALGYVLTMRGKPQEGLPWMDAAVRLNPFHPKWYHSNFGVALYSLRRFADAAQAFRRMEDRGPWTLARTAACLAQLGRDAEAGSQVAEVLRKRPDFSIADFMRRSVLLELPQDRELLQDGLTKAGLPQ